MFVAPFTALNPRHHLNTPRPRHRRRALFQPFNPLRPTLPSPTSAPRPAQGPVRVIPSQDDTVCSRPPRPQGFGWRRAEAAPTMSARDQIQPRFDHSYSQPTMSAPDQIPRPAGGAPLRTGRSSARPARSKLDPHARLALVALRPATGSRSRPGRPGRSGRRGGDPVAGCETTRTRGSTVAHISKVQRRGHGAGRPWPGEAGPRRTSVGGASRNPRGQRG